MNFLHTERLYRAENTKRKTLADFARPRPLVITRDSTVGDIKAIVKGDVKRILREHKPASVK